MSLINYKILNKTKEPHYFTRKLLYTYTFYSPLTYTFYIYLFFTENVY